MALVVLLRGVNVGGHRSFHPSLLAKQLKHLDVINIGAAGTFVIRKPVSRTALRAALARRLPFETQIAIVEGLAITTLMSRDHFAGEPVRSDVTRFVTVLARASRTAPSTPISYPATGRWLVKVIAREKQFVIGKYRRDMKTIGYLGKLDHAFGVPVTTRNWNTMAAIAKVLSGEVSA